MLVVKGEFNGLSRTFLLSLLLCDVCFDAAVMLRPVANLCLYYVLCAVNSITVCTTHYYLKQTDAYKSFSNQKVLPPIKKNL